MTTTPAVMKGETIQVAAPSGTMFVIVMEVDGRPAQIEVLIGKAGTQVAAWAQASTVLINALLERGESLDFIMESLRDITSDRVARGLTRTMRSDVEAVYYALNAYRNGQKRVDTYLDIEDITGPERNVSVAPWARVRGRQS